MANITLSPKAAKAVKKYSLDTCLAAFDHNREGNGARTVAIEIGLPNTNAADAAINAGREYTVFTTGRDDISIRPELHRSLSALAQAQSAGRPHSSIRTRETHFGYSIHD